MKGERNTMITTNAVLVGKNQGPGDEILHRLPIESPWFINQSVRYIGRVTAWERATKYTRTIYIYIYIFIYLFIYIYIIITIIITINYVATTQKIEQTRTGSFYHYIWLF